MNKDIRYLKGVGEKRAELFNKKGIKTVEDLLYFFPRAHEDRSEFKKIADCAAGETVCIDITVFSPVRENRIRGKRIISSMIACDDSDSINVIWYNNKYVKNQFHTDERYILYGKITENKYHKKELINPVAEKKDKQHFTGMIVPVYPLTEGLTQKLVQSAMEQAIKEYGNIDEYIPDSIREKYRLSQINYAMKNIHFPESFEAYNIARRRFVFEELLTLQLALSSRKSHNTLTSGAIFSDVKQVRGFSSSLPFGLTNAQKRVINEICADLKSGKAMNRLVQGDVGSGKTAVAAAAIYLAVKNGFQAAMMAPTEILAVQHKESLDGFLKPFGINVVLLTGSMKASDKNAALEAISAGSADVVIGTHALIQNNVEFKNLALAITDEQHRFGVEQRAKLAAKGHGVHILIMSATPIPRTLALILYGDLDVSVIDELPPGRKPIKTYAVGEKMRARAYAFMEKNIKEGSQAYIVCPLVEETETGDLKNASDLQKKLSERYSNIRIGLIHGRMKSKDKDSVMNGFVNGDIDVLVSTTVIEVGVNVPNANLMIIENAERFGLSQLHQLRGRVGRGAKQASCILIAHGNNEITKKRMETMCLSNDGFYISEQDLKLRGPGDFFGTRQHGLPEMRIANLFSDTDILIEAQKAAAEILEKDPQLIHKDHTALKKRCDRIIPKEIIMN